MGNSQINYLKDPNLNKFKGQFSKVELYMLALLFKDLSARQHGVIDKETFLQFFPLTGLWGERLFEKFDLKHTGHINFIEFVQGIATCCHSTEDEKIHLLFSLYDWDQDGFIKKKEMITMLYNYPKNHIKFITDEIAPDGGEKLARVTEAKRQSLGNLDDDGYGNNTIPMSATGANIRKASIQSVDSDNVAGALNDELVVAEEQQGFDKVCVERNIKQSFAYFAQKEQNEREIAIRMSQNLDALASPGNGRKTARKDLSLDTQSVPKKASGNLAPLEVPMDSAVRKYSYDKDKAPSKSNNELVPNSGLALRKGRRSSASTIIMDQSFVLATTVNTRVKEYASFMFKTFEGANRSGKISYDEFKQWLSMHPVILKVFDDTFHQNIWSTQNTEETGKISSPFDELDKEKTSPHESNTNTLKTSPTNRAMVPEHLKYREKPAECSGYLFKKGKKSKSWQKRYFELYEHFMFYYEKKSDKIPKGILFLEGCYIEETKDYNTTHKYGLVITHKSDSYEPHTLYCNTKAELDEWMSHLKLFQSSTIMDLYSFKEKIGTGKFSVVYRAITKDAKQNEYAVKVIEKKCLKPEEKEFLLSETSVMKILDHPSMIKLIDTVETKTHIYIVTEIVKDGDLFDYIITREYLEEHTASFIMKQLLISIYYLHGLGIIHRDIKPENILITLDHEEIKELKIIDFGFAKLVNEGVSVTETCGTPNYVAPEVLRGCGYDKRADIFSLGVIMYLMVRGLLPFDDHEVNTILKNTLKGDVPMEDEHWRNVSPECKDLLTKFLAKNPAERIDIRDALKHPWIKDRENLKKYEGVNRRKEGEY